MIGRFVWTALLVAAMVTPVFALDAPDESAMEESAEAGARGRGPAGRGRVQHHAQRHLPPVDLDVKDEPADEGGAVRLTWKPCPKAGAATGEKFVIYRATRSDAGHWPFEKVGEFPLTDHLTESKNGKVYRYVDEGLSDEDAYYYRVAAVRGDLWAYAFKMMGTTPAVDFGPVSSIRQVIAYGDRAAIRNGLPADPPTEVSAADKPNDAGEAIIVTWTPSKHADQVPGLTYRIYRSEKPEGPFDAAGSVSADKNSYMDSTHKGGEGKTWYYVVAATNLEGTKFAVSDASNGAAAKTQIINWEQWNYFLFAVVLSVFIVYFIQHIKSGKKLFVRKIAGMEAVDEAIGRATEMGKPIMFVPGIMDMNDVQTVAAVAILGRVARTVAEYDTRLMCPTSKSLVMTTGRETVKEAFLSAGRPDAYNDDIVTYLTDEQFGYVAGVNGMMVRDKPATILYLGAFYAESLIMAETGNSIGAIQIAGTAQPAQLPFFIAACDYTLIGEELFAASAYLSHDPKQLGSLKGQDIGKLLGMLGIIFGATLATVAELSGAGWAQTALNWVSALFTVSAG
ncbi:MAG: hypothetical protein M5R36_06400 [Deltaproteobacteria bacterium]|nr:hypothetical protein [Deltaproteobacteria bacterium]